MAIQMESAPQCTTTQETEPDTTTPSLSLKVYYMETDYYKSQEYEYYGYYWGIVTAKSPEEAECRFRKRLSYVMCGRQLSSPHNRREASRRIAKRDFRVKECQKRTVALF